MDEDDFDWPYEDEIGECAVCGCRVLDCERYEECDEGFICQDCCEQDC